MVDGILQAKYPCGDCKGAGFVARGAVRWTCVKCNGSGVDTMAALEGMERRLIQVEKVHQLKEEVKLAKSDKLEPVAHYNATFLGIRSELAEFMDTCEIILRDGDNKVPQWQAISVFGLHESFLKEVELLRIALSHQNIEHARKQCCDIANYAMFLFHNIGHKVGLTTPPVPMSMSPADMPPSRPPVPESAESSCGDCIHLDSANVCGKGYGARTPHGVQCELHFERRK